MLFLLPEVLAQSQPRGQGLFHPVRGFHCKLSLVWVSLKAVGGWGAVPGC